MCGSTKYPYLPHGRFSRLNSPSPLEFYIKLHTFPYKFCLLRPPSPSEFAMTFHGVGMDIFWNHIMVICARKRLKEACNYMGVIKQNGRRRNLQDLHMEHVFFGQNEMSCTAMQISRMEFPRLQLTECWHKYQGTLLNEVRKCLNGIVVGKFNNLNYPGYWFAFSFASVFLLYIIIKQNEIQTIFKSTWIPVYFSHGRTVVLWNKSTYFRLFLEDELGVCITWHISLVCNYTILFYGLVCFNNV